jgi:hypothetical protein
MADDNAPEVPKKGRQVIVFTWIIVRRAGSAAHISAHADIVALRRVAASVPEGTSGFILFGLGGKMASFGNFVPLPFPWRCDGAPHRLGYFRKILSRRGSGATVGTGRIDSWKGSHITYPHDTPEFRVPNN